MYIYSGPTGFQSTKGSHRVAKVFRSFRQMGLTPDSMHLRRAPMEQRERRGRRDGKGRHRWSPAEKVQRWISWVVQAGYKEL